jgi:hypothetical protein
VTLRRRGEPILLILGGRRATMAASVGGVVRLKLCINVGELQAPPAKLGASESG